MREKDRRISFEKQYIALDEKGIAEIRAKAIDEFAEEMYRRVADSNLNQYKDDVVEMIDEIAERMKNGEIDRKIQ